MTGILLLGLLLVPALLAIWLAKRDRAQTRLWGDQPSQNSVMGGAELEMPRILPVEPVSGPMVNGAPVDDTTHEQVFSQRDMKRLPIDLGSTG